LDRNSYAIELKNFLQDYFSIAEAFQTI